MPYYGFDDLIGIEGESNSTSKHRLKPAARQKLQKAGMSAAGISALVAGKPIVNPKDAAIVASIVKMALG